MVKVDFRLCQEKVEVLIRKVESKQSLIWITKIYVIEKIVPNDQKPQDDI